MNSTETFSSRIFKYKSILRVPSVDVLIALVTSALVIAVTKFEREGFVRISLLYTQYFIEISAPFL